MFRLMAAATVMTAGVSFACACVDRPILLSGDVAARNTRPLISVLSSQVGGMELIGPDREPRRVTVEPFSNERLVVPNEPLVVGLRYVLASGFRLARSFVISDQADETAPAMPTGRVGERQYVNVASDCNRAGGATTYPLTITGNEDDLVFYEVFTGPSESEIDFTSPAFIASSGDTQITDRICDPNFEVTDTPNIAIAVRAIDGAGNVSSFSVAHQLKTNGCSTTPGLFVLQSLIPLFRRKR